MFFLGDADDVGQELLPHLPLAGGARPDGSDVALDDDLQLHQFGFVHAGAPSMPPILPLRSDVDRQALPFLLIPPQQEG
jgi:hypothetical protein